MLVLEASGDGKIIVALSDDSEIEITITELEVNRFTIEICIDAQVSIARKTAQHMILKK